MKNAHRNNFFPKKYLSCKKRGKEKTLFQFNGV